MGLPKKEGPTSRKLVDGLLGTSSKESEIRENKKRTSH